MPRIATVSALILSALASVPAQAWSPSRGPWFVSEGPNVRVITDLGPADARSLARHLEGVHSLLVLAGAATPQDTSRCDVWVFRRMQDLEVLAGNGDVVGLFRNEALEPRAILFGGSDAQLTATHEYVHRVLSHARSVPRWLEEGLAEFYSTTAFDGHEWVVGRYHPGHIRGTVARPSAVTPLLTSKEPSLEAAYYGLAWSWTHFLMLGDEKLRENLPKFAALLSGGAAPDTASHVAFGTPLAELEERWHRYLQVRPLPEFRVPASELRAVEPSVARRLTKPEFRIELARLVTFSAALTADAVLELARDAYVARKDDPSLKVGYAWALTQTGGVRQAVELAEAALREAPGDDHVRLVAAGVFTVAGDVATSESEAGRHAARAIDLLEPFLARHPHDRAAWWFYGEAGLLLPDGAAVLRRLDEAVIEHPDYDAVRARQAALRLKLGDVEGAWSATNPLDEDDQLWLARRTVAISSRDAKGGRYDAAIDRIRLAAERATFPKVREALLDVIRQLEEARRKASPSPTPAAPSAPGTGGG